MVLFKTDNTVVRPLGTDEKGSALEVYRQCKDFLALGPIPEASMEMVEADMDNSRKQNGTYCGIWDTGNNQIGVLDFVPEKGKGISELLLLMIAKPYRHAGIGTEVIQVLETYLKEKYDIKVIDSGVQVNNAPGISFWKKCGFIIEKEARDMGDGTTAFKMRKFL